MSLLRTRGTTVTAWASALMGAYGPLLVMFGLVTCLWWPALWQGKLLIYGDSGLHGLPSLWMIGDAFQGKVSLLWSNRIFGGHPMFAEGQGGFSNPLTLLSVWCFGPLYALGALHWLNMLIGCAGVYAACRVLDISRWSATFAAIVVVFSGIWISSQQNLPTSSTLPWIAWLFAAVEFWLKAPSTKRAVLLAVPVALMVFSGYPQLVHGAALYALVSLLPQIFKREEAGWDAIRRWRMLLATGLLAIVLAAGLSAIQLLPLLELVGESNRNHGTGLLFGGNPLFWKFVMQEMRFYFCKPILKGMLFFYFGPVEEGENVVGLANLAVFGLMLLLAIVRTPSRIFGHLLGLLLLFNLGVGVASPLFRFVYLHDLIPGLHYFRSMGSYVPVAVVGMGIVSAYVLDAISSSGNAALRKPFRGRSWMLGALAVLSCGAFIALCYRLHVPVYGRLVFLAPVLMAAGFVVLLALDRRSLFPLVAVIFFSIDILASRIDSFDFYDRSVVAQPDEIRTIADESGIQDFRVKDASLGGLIVFIPPKDPTIGKAYRRMHRTLSPFTSALHWKIPSIDGVLALWLGRRDILEAIFSAEVDGKSPTPPGFRMIDILGIRYISRDAELGGKGLTLFAHDQKESIFIYRNDYAKPRFQVYWDAEAVGKPEQALEGLEAARSEKLFVERRRGESPPPTGGCVACAAAKPAVEVAEATAMRYRVKVDMPQEGWLFLADAYYPGWEATVNGAKRPVYAAQVLGKAVHLDAGRNEVTIRYVPRMFYIGAAVSAITLVLSLSILFGPHLMRYLGRKE